MRFIHLGDSKLNHNTCGKKALHLHLLIQEGLPIPPGFVVASDQVITQESASALLESIERLGGFPVAVRSSGLFEDSESASFAGQYVSHLNVASVEELIEKIKACRHHAQSEHLKTYSRERGLGEVNTAKMAVLVQKMVSAAKAGVSFTIHPLTGKEEDSLHEVCRGLGEGLVSGHVQPSQYVYNFLTDSVVTEELGSESERLTLPELKILAETCWEASAHFGSPQDIEWAFDQSGVFYLLQSRPITKVQFRSDISEMTNADLKDGGVSSKVCTTLMYSLYAEAFDYSMQKYMSDILLFPRQEQVSWMLPFYGRVYWDASLVKRCLFKIPGFSEKSFDEDLGIQKEYGSMGPVQISSTNPFIIARAIPVAIALDRQFSSCLQMTEAFSGKYETHFNFWRAEIQRLSVPSVREQDVFAQFIRFANEMFLWTERSYFTTIYNNSNLQTLFKDELRKIQRKTAIQIDIAKLIAGLSDISHLELQKDFIKLYEVAEQSEIGTPAWKQALEAFIKKNYFHSDMELDISVPRWEECPEVIEKRVAAMLLSQNRPSDPDLTSRKQLGECELELQRVQTEIKKNYSGISGYFAQKKLTTMLHKVRTYLSRREKMREYSTRTYYLVRKFVKIVGQVMATKGYLESSDDIFHLTLPEILGALRMQYPDAGLLTAIHKRKLLYKGFARFAAPNEFGKGIQQAAVAELSQTESGDFLLKGLGCSSGVIEAPARVIHSMDEIHLIQAGEIVITRFTDPSWTPVLGMIKGIVTEVGGLLSHAAVISREYGIPAVLNVINATQLIKTGQRLRVDGASGQIVVLKETS